MRFTPFREKEVDEETGRVRWSKTRLAIQSRLSENKIFLSSNPDYMETLRTSARNQQELKAWVFGSWDIVAGGMFADLWNEKYHVIPPFQIPRNWRIDRSLDWGSSKPFSVGWYAESDGIPVVCPVTGELRGEIKGDVFRISEWYGTTGKPNEGIGLTGTEMGEGIRERELEMAFQGDVHKRVRPGPADHNIFGEGGKTVSAKAETIHSKMMNVGVRFEKALKGPGSRKAGWQVCRDYLGNALPVENGEREEPGLYIFENCRHFIKQIPTLTRSDADPDDIDTEIEDHIADELRYRLRRIRRSMSKSGF